MTADKTGGEWRDMSSAPKDGQEIDLWISFPSGDVRWTDAKWREAGEHNCTGPANWCSREGFPLHAFTEQPVAIAWMPLPSPPLPNKDKSHEG